MATKKNNKNGLFNPNEFLVKYFGFDVLEMPDTALENVPGSVEAVSENTAYATASLEQLCVPLPSEMNLAVEDRIKRSRKGNGGMVLKILELIEDPYNNDKEWVNSQEGRTLIDMAIDYYVKNGIDNAVLSRFCRSRDCPRNPVIPLSKIAVDQALENNDLKRAYRVCYNAEDYIKGGRIAKKEGNKKIAKFFFSKGLKEYLPEYAQSYTNKGVGTMVKIGDLKITCAKELGLTSLLRFMDLKEVVRYKRNKRYFEAGQKLSKLGLDKRAKEMYEMAISEAKIVPEIPRPEYYGARYGTRMVKNLGEIQDKKRLLMNGIYSSLLLNRLDKAEEFKSRMRGHEYYPHFLDDKDWQKLGNDDDVILYSL